MGLRRNPAGIGCRGGTSATAGKKSQVYAFTYPDGRTETARTFKVADAEAVAHCYRARDGVWYLAGIARPGSPAPFSPPGSEVSTVPARAVL